MITLSRAFNLGFKLDKSWPGPKLNRDALNVRTCTSAIFRKPYEDWSRVEPRRPRSPVLVREKDIDPNAVVDKSHVFSTFRRTTDGTTQMVPRSNARCLAFNQTPLVIPGPS